MGREKKVILEAPDADGRPSENVVPFPRPVRLERSLGSVLLGFVRRGDDTAVADLYQSGCAKVRFPLPEPSHLREAVLLNTAGGLTDGDRLSTAVDWGESARALVTTQAAERIYRSRAGSARMDSSLVAAAGAFALWLPQETILFDGAHLERRTTVDMDPAARLIACESVIFGRDAMGEIPRSGSIVDSWRVRIGGRLVFADGLRLSGDMASALDRPAVAGGARGLATIICALPDVQRRISLLRGIGPVEGAQIGCSCLGDTLVARIVARSGFELRRAMSAALTILMRGAEASGASPSLPRVWSC